MKKLLLSMSCLVLTFIFCFGTVQASTTIAEGITLFEVSTTIGGYPQKIKHFKVHIGDPAIKIDVLNDASILSRDDVKARAEEAGALAAINGTFKDVQHEDASGWSAPKHTIIKSGNILTAHDTANPARHFYVTNGNDPYISDLTVDIVLTGPNGTKPAEHINKFSDDFNDFTILTTDFRTTSIGNIYNNMVEVVVGNNGTITEIRRNQAAITIPSGGFVLVTRETSGKIGWVNNLAVGDAVSFAVNITPSDDKYMAIWGDANLVVNGTAIHSYDLSNCPDANTRSPRTAIGYTDAGAYVHMVTVDGRQPGYSQGLTYAEMADLMVSYNCYNAINLDGGGSTTAVAKINGTYTLLNSPSDGSMRNVVNAIGVFRN